MANADRVTITTSTKLAAPVEVEVRMTIGSRLEKVFEVEWVAEGYLVEDRPVVNVHGLGRGTYSTWCAFTEDTMPEWAPKPPAFLRDSVRKLLAF